MKLSIISFTKNGSLLARRLGLLLEESGHDCRVFVPDRFRPKEEDDLFSLGKKKAVEWAGEMFFQGRSMIFIGAAGIAVRSVAPWLKDKFQDPAVVVMDEAGQFVIPILSGHAGGANELSRLVGSLTGALPVITTATDVNRVFSVDEFAVQHGLVISDRYRAKKIAMALLEGEPVGFFSDFPIEDPGKKSLTWIPEGCVTQTQQKNIRITVRQRGDDWQADDLILRPKALVLGVGCRKGIEAEILQREIDRALEKANLSPSAVKVLATIDIKAHEKAIQELSRSRGWQLECFTAEELKRVPGEFSSSEFVRKTVGVDNVCERAACAAAQDGHLVMKKTAGNGVTAAAFLEKVELEK